MALVVGDHLPWHGGAADEHPLHLREIPLAGLCRELLQDPHPDRRHARRPRDALLRHVLEQALRVEVRTGVDELRPDHRRDVRVAPRVRVEHRHHRHDRVVHRRPEPERVVRGDAERVQHRRPVRVDDAFRQPRRPARVTHRRRLSLVELEVAKLVARRSGEQLLVGVLDDEDVLDVRAVLELLEERQQRAVDDHRAVVRMRGDVREVVRMQAQVQRVEDEAAARNPEVRLVVLPVVPAQRRDAVAALEPELPQRDRELLRAGQRLGVGRAVEGLVREPADDLAAAEVRLRPPQQVRERQREVHHQAVHRIKPPRRRRAARRPPLRAAAPAARRSPRSTTPACRNDGAGAPT